MPVLSTDTARLNGMPKPSAATTPFHLVYGGDSYLNDQTVRDLKHEAQRRYPDAETIELDAANADHYAFDEAVSPSLLADRAIVIVTNLQNADEKLGDAMVSYCRQASCSTRRLPFTPPSCWQMTMHASAGSLHACLQ